MTTHTLQHLARHYLEMVVAMFAGMVVLGGPADLALDPGPAAMFVVMAATMTVPMLAWMAYRGHGGRAHLEMSASMFVPALAAAGLFEAGLMTDSGALMALEHVAMLLAMLGVMLARPAEYAGRHA